MIVLCRNRSAEAHVHFCMWILGSWQKSWLTFFVTRVCVVVLLFLSWYFTALGDGWGDSLAEKNPYGTLSISNNGNSDKGKLLFPDLFHCTAPKVGVFLMCWSKIIAIEGSLTSGMWHLVHKLAKSVKRQFKSYKGAYYWWCHSHGLYLSCQSSHFSWNWLFYLRRLNRFWYVCKII